RVDTRIRRSTEAPPGFGGHDASLHVGSPESKANRAKKGRVTESKRKMVDDLRMGGVEPEGMTNAELLNKIVERGGDGTRRRQGSSMRGGVTHGGQATAGNIRDALNLTEYLPGLTEKYPGATERFQEVEPHPSLPPNSRVFASDQGMSPEELAQF